jgi:hypothetical protein
MHSIAMTKSGTIHKSSIVVDGRSAIDNLIATIGIHIRHTKIMNTLPIQSYTSR